MSDSLRAFILTMAPEIDPKLLEELIGSLPAVGHKRGDILVRQGEVATDCYFVLQGCLRVYFLGEDSNEHTTDFITELQSLVIFESFKQNKPSPYSVECVEDCLLLEGDLANEEKTNRKFPFLQEITRNAMESNLTSGQNDMALFKAASPQQRYLQVLEKRPGLAARVPQHQLASYLGITPESLSRIKKRLYSS